MYSQFSEDDILEKYLVDNRIMIPPLVVDIGAGDGVTGSNSKLFIEKYNYKGILVEVDPAPYSNMETLYKDNQNVKLINKAIDKTVHGYDISFSGYWQLNRVIKNTKSKNKTVKLSTLLKKEKANEIGILSLDTEGLDSDILEELLKNTTIRPWIIIIEGNHLEDQELQRKLLEGEYDLFKTINVNQIFTRKDILSLQL